jgi:hypothetical protein
MRYVLKKLWSDYLSVIEQHIKILYSEALS